MTEQKTYSPLDSLAKIPANPLVVENQQVENPNDIDHWLVAINNSSSGGKKRIFKRAFEHIDLLPKAYQADFRVAIVRALEEEGLTEVELELEHQTPVPIGSTEVDIRKIEGQTEIASADLERYKVALNVSIDQFVQESDEYRKIQRLRVFIDFLQINSELNKNLEELIASFADIVAARSTEICLAVKVEVDLTTEDSFLLDAQPLLAVLLRLSIEKSISPNTTIIVTQSLHSYLTGANDAFLLRPQYYQDLLEIDLAFSAQGYEQAVQFYLRLLNQDFDRGISDLINLIKSAEVQQALNLKLVQRIVNEVIFDNDPERIIPLGELIAIYESTARSQTVDSLQSLRIVLKANLRQMKEAEEQDAGVVRFLLQQRGIKHFARYPVDLLIDQKNRDTSQNGYILLLMPEDDHNAAFNMKARFKDLKTQATVQRVGVKIIEAGSGREMLARLNQLTRECGKASGAFVGAHGSLDAMAFGAGNEGSVEKDAISLRSPLIRRALKKFFSPRSVLVLLSCSTGGEEGIAQELARQGIEVIAPVESASTNELSLAKKRGRVTIDADFDVEKKVFKSPWWLRFFT